MKTTEEILANSPLGQSCDYIATYQPDLLFPIERAFNRKKIGIADKLPFYGQDIWNAFELSWLNPKGKPQVALAEFILPCESPCLVESKSIKLYLNSFNDTVFESINDVQTTMEKDLSHAAGLPVQVHVISLDHVELTGLSSFTSPCLDNLDITIEHYDVTPALLKKDDSKSVREQWHSNLLKSNCQATAQPDWGSVEVTYQGPAIDPAGLLAYIISYRHHQGFHEPCVERIFVDIMSQCQPTELTVEARYVRRGGLDINPIRSTQPNIQQRNARHIRQ